MESATKILGINGSYRAGGITDQAIDLISQKLKENGAAVEIIALRDYPINFCLNCRECTQKSGTRPGHCVQEDAMQALIDKIEQADGYILASPTNLGSLTALFKRFMERLVVYAFWPWDQNYPEYRKIHLPQKKAVLISSCAAPAFLGRWLYGSHRQLKMTAKIIGARSVGSLFTGKISKQAHKKLPEAARKKAINLAEKLAQKSE